MPKSRLFCTSALRSALVLGFAFAAGAPAYAQDTATTTEDPPETLQSEVEIQSGEEASAGAQGESAEGPGITVTGSRIRRPNLESTIPIVSIGGETVLEQAKGSLGDTLNELPQLRSTFAQQNPGLGVGIAGLNLLDLRGLGTQRTLVLVNGRRHVASDFLNNGVSPDINTIPVDLIERVDIVTGGNSAIYGSDAIAGVVNFILKRDFDGLQVRGKAGVGGFGFGGNQYVSAMYGLNFGDRRGNITLHAEYAHQDRVFASQIPYLRQFDALGVVDLDPAGLPNGSDGIPDRVFLRDLRLRNGHRFGLIPITQPAANPRCGTGVNTSPAPGTPYNCLLVFGPDGSLRPSDETARFSTGTIGGALGGTVLQNGREENLLSVLPGQDRYNVNLLAHYSFSDAFETFVEAKFARIDTQGSNAGTNGISGIATHFDRRERPRLDNPFLTSEQRATIAQALLDSGCNNSISTACVPLTAAQRADIAAGTYRFVLARNLQDHSIRDEIFQRDTYRVVGGLRGTFNDDWSYEVSANYGLAKEKTVTTGYQDRQRFSLSMDAAINPATGQIQCRAQFDPTAALAYDSGPFQAGGTARTQQAQRDRLAADIAACVPYDPFGRNDNSAAVAYFAAPYRVAGEAEQLVFSGFVSGDSSQLFELPGGPIRFAVGAEYRQEDIFYRQSAEAAAGRTSAVAFGSFEPDTFEVKEAFGELQLPILSEVPFFHDLTLTGAARVAKYQGGVGTVFAYNAGGEWAPVRDIRFRANYGRAVRAPNSSETFGELIPNFAPGFNDPCNPANLGTGSQFRAANCQADLGALLGNLQNAVVSLPVLSGVNPDLFEETSDSITIGAVIQPRWIPGLSVSVDYFDIEVKDVIVSATAQQIANSCYDQPDLNNIFCTLFERYRGTGTGPGGEIPGEILDFSLIQAPLNYASRVRRGIDTQVTYRATIADDVRLSTNLIYTHNLKNSNFQDPSRPDFENRILGELGDPVDEFRWDTDLSVDAFTFGYRLRYIGPMWVNAYEDFNSLNGLPPQDADYADIRQYPKVFYHDFRIEWDLKGVGGIGRDWNFYVGVDNAFNRTPPLDIAGTGTGGSNGDRQGQGASNAAIYDVRGRQFYAGFKALF